MGEQSCPNVLKLVCPEATAMANESTVGNEMSYSSGTFLWAVLQQHGRAARQDVVAEYIEAALVATLGDVDIDSDMPLAEVGIDSLAAIEFVSALQLRIGNTLSLSPTLVYNYPTIRKLAEYVESTVFGSGGEEQQQADVIYLDA